MDIQSDLSSASKHKGMDPHHLRDLVRQESPSEDRQAVNAAVSHGRTLGSRSRRHAIKRHDQENSATSSSFVSAHALHRKSLSFFLGHLDTVWPMGTLEKMPWREEKGRYLGPGVLDMKAGVVMALAA